MTPIPEDIQKIVKSSVAVVKAFRHLRRAGEEKASEEARKKYRKQLQTSLEVLDAAVSGWKPAPATPAQPFDWNGLFRSATRGLELIRDLKGGKVGPREVARWIDAEVADMPPKR